MAFTRTYTRVPAASTSLATGINIMHGRIYVHSGRSPRYFLSLPFRTGGTSSRVPKLTYGCLQGGSIGGDKMIIQGSLTDR